ncbi:hypothetical protein LX70_00580 [Defluviimonas denitrificans]|uniref:Uncharacterized protein n=2 Tax=Albidovulum denitrificans TaxID=404881 RepID=A0A2S8SD35_9RHOB|nr:hypothetical protein LX70_00580 [Defluviimonas denitrificans]
MGPAQGRRGGRKGRPEMIYAIIIAAVIFTVAAWIYAIIFIAACAYWFPRRMLEGRDLVSAGALTSAAIALTYLVIRLCLTVTPA